MPNPTRAPRSKKVRCEWCTGSDVYIEYHDEEWGVPVYDDARLFEFLVLEGAQAGLSWETILKKRVAYRAAFDDFAIAAVRRALPTARVGGPDVAGAGGAFMDGFLAHVTSGTNYATGAIGTPTDFLSFHAKGRPAFVDGHVRMGISTHLKEIDNGFQKIAAIAPLGVQAIVSANVGCIQHLQTGTATPVRHWIEVLDVALVAR